MYYVITVLATIGFGVVAIGFFMVTGWLIDKVASLVRYWRAHGEARQREEIRRLWVARKQQRRRVVNR